MDSMNQMPYPSQNSDKGGIGPWIAVIIIIILLMLGGIYFWKEKAAEKGIYSTSTSNYERQGTTSDNDILNIEAGLKATEETDTNDAGNVDSEFTR